MILVVYSMSQSFITKIISWLLSFVTLLGILIFQKPLIAAGLLSVWIMYQAYIAIMYRSRIYEILTQLFTMFSFLWLLVLVESVFLRWFIVLVSIPIFFFLVWMNSEYTGRLVHIKEKPLRRMRMMIHVFNMYAGCIAFFAVDVYFPSIPAFALVIGAGVYGAIITLLIWKLYFKSSNITFIIPLVVVCMGVSECMWALRLTPFGYLAQGLLVVWLWYIVQLLARFHLSTRGIVWKEQRTFLCTNAVLFGLVLYLIRWV